MYSRCRLQWRALVSALVSARSISEMIRATDRIEFHTQRRSLQLSMTTCVCVRHARNCYLTCHVMSARRVVLEHDVIALGSHVKG